MNRLKCKVSDTLYSYKILLRSIPSGVISIQILCCCLMNLMANRELLLPVKWLVLDCGFLLSWVSFLCMDMITKRFGAKAAVRVSILAVIVNLIVCGVFFICTKLPGNWAVYYDYSDVVVNEALDSTFGGTWYVILGSTIAMLVSSVVNSVCNSSIGRLLKRDTFAVFAIRSYVSTALGQFVDNLVFAFLVSHVFFGWTFLQCIVCAFTGAIAELLCEVVLSPVGYRVCRRWDKEDVGSAYLDFIKEE